MTIQATGRSTATSATVWLEPRVSAPDAVATADLDLIIPALNEELRIGRTVSEICEQIVGAPFTARIIVVDNGCVDATAEAVDAASNAGITVDIIGCRARGKGAAIKAGIRHSDAPYIGYCDADLSTPPAAIASGYQLLEEGWDVVIGSRRCEGSSYETPQPLLRRVGSQVFSLAARRLVGDIRDTQCGFKMFKQDVAVQVIDALELDGFAFDVELIARTLRAGHRLVELPIAWSDAAGSSFRPLRDGPAAFADLYSVHKAMRRTDSHVDEG